MDQAQMIVGIHLNVSMLEITTSKECQAIRRYLPIRTKLLAYETARKLCEKKGSKKNL